MNKQRVTQTYYKGGQQHLADDTVADELLRYSSM